MEEKCSIIDALAGSFINKWCLKPLFNMLCQSVFNSHDRLQGFALADDILVLAESKQVLTSLVNLFHAGLMHLLLT